MNENQPQVGEKQPPNHSDAGRSNNRKPMTKGTLAAVIALVAVVAFVAGTRSNQLYAAVAPVLGLKVASGTLDTAVLQQTYRSLAANFDGELDAAKLEDGAVRGMVAAAGDTYTVFMDKKEAEDFNKDLDGQVSGIGAEIGVRNDQPTILRVISDSPAENAGLQSGDVFVSVNGKSMNGKMSGEVAQDVRGDVGTTVKLTMKRGDVIKEYAITRAQVSDESVRWSVKDGVGVMTISRFDNQTSALATKAATEFKAQQVSGVVVDLRDNGGGYLDAAQEVAGLWLDNKVVVTEKANSKVIDTIKAAKGGALLAGVKTIVLVNGGSASASEIVAGALKDYGAATLVGEKTFGKGSVQKVLELPEGRLLKVTVAKWYTPKDKNINGEGINPDRVVKLTADDSNKGLDPQMAAALGLF